MTRHNYVYNGTGDEGNADVTRVLSKKLTKKAQLTSIGYSKLYLVLHDLLPELKQFFNMKSATP